MSSIRTSNMVASLSRAVATSVLSLVLPIALAVVMPPAGYAAWALTFGLAAYLLYLDLGIPTAIAVLTTREVSGRQGSARADAAWSGVLLTMVVGVVATLVLLGVSIRLGQLYPSIPSAFRGDASRALVILALGQACTLVANAATMYFVGIQEFWKMATSIVPFRLSAALAAFTAACFSDSLTLVAIGFSAPLLLGAAWTLARIGRPTLRRRDVPSELRTTGVARFAGPVGMMNIAMAVIVGTDLVIVGRVDYGSVRDYAVAATMAAGVLGLSSPALAPLLPVLSDSHVRGDITGARNLVATWTRLAFTIAVVAYACSVALVLILPTFGGALPYVEWLAAGMIARITILPASMAVIAVGKAHVLMLPAVAEALANLGLSVWLGSVFGAAGVAVGTTIPALAASLAAAFYMSKLVSAKGEPSVKGPLMSVGPRLAGVVLVFGVSASWLELVGTSPTSRSLAWVAMALVLALVAKDAAGFLRPIFRTRVR